MPKDVKSSVLTKSKNSTKRNTEVVAVTHKSDSLNDSVVYNSPKLENFISSRANIGETEQISESTPNLLQNTTT